MPIYEYKCKTCDKEFEKLARIDDRHKTKCDCGGDSQLLISSSISRDWFRPHMNENIDTNGPIYVESKGHYKKLCKERGLEARCLM